MPGERLLDIFSGKRLHLIKEQLQMVQRQAIEADGAQLGHDRCVIGSAQRELTVDLALGADQFRFGRAFADESVQALVDDRQGQIHLVGTGLHAHHHRAGGLHRDQPAADRVGQSTGLTDLFHEP